jgi:hypothetical protein
VLLSHPLRHLELPPQVNPRILPWQEQPDAHVINASGLQGRDRKVASWTVTADIDLHTWLFAFGAGIRIEAPAELRQEHQERLQAALAVYVPS